MTLPVELEASVNQLRAKHTALIDAVNAYRNGTIDASKQDLLDLADDIDKQLTVEEYTLLGQAARKVRMPSLLLDFANGKYAVGVRRLERFTSLEGILTFSRSTGGGRFNAQGQYEWVGPDVPRIDCDPVTGECKGLLIEEQRTNIFRHSNGSGVIIGSPESTADAVVSPNGTQDATLINLIASNSTRYELTIAANTYAAGQQFAVSWYQKRVNYTGNGSAHAPGALLALSSLVNISSERPVKMESLPNGWERWGSVATLDDPAVETRLRMYFGGTGFNEEIVTVTDPYAFWGIDVQPGEFHTSHIPTSGAVVTRAADTVSLASVEPWFNRSEGTFYMDVESFPPRRSQYLLTSGANTRFLYRHGGLAIGSYDGSSTSRSSGSGAILPGRVASWYDATSFRVAAEGSLGSRLQGGETLRAVQHLSIMVNDSGHVKKLEYYPRAFTESELQEITAI